MTSVSVGEVELIHHWMLRHQERTELNCQVHTHPYAPFMQLMYPPESGHQAVLASDTPACGAGSVDVDTDWVTDLDKMEQEGFYSL